MTSIREMNYNVDGRNLSGKSSLGKIQQDLLQLYLQKNPTLEQLQNFGRFLITNPNMMDQPNLYRGIENVEFYFEQALRETMEKQNSSVTYRGMAR